MSRPRLKQENCLGGFFDFQLQERRKLMSNSQLLRSSLKLRDQHTFCLFFHRKVSERAILRETAKENKNKDSGDNFNRKSNEFREFRTKKKWRRHLKI